VSYDFDKKKYNDLNPIIAKILELYTINGSVVTAKIAGILSKANNKSVNLEGKNDGYIEASIDFIRESFQNKTDAAQNSGSAFVNTDSAANMDAMEKLEKARQEKIAADKNRWKEPFKK
jgi:hypothetical protein